MPSCKEISTILSSHQELPFYKKVQLHIHLILCSQCLKYKKQLDLITTNMKKLYEKKTAVSQAEIDKLKEDVMNRIEHKQDKQ